VYWYLKYYDPTDDRCCLCRELIDDEHVPLVLFHERGRATLMARFHMEPCGASLLQSGYFAVKD
jgi:hypothetical protein